MIARPDSTGPDRRSGDATHFPLCRLSRLTSCQPGVVREAPGQRRDALIEFVILQNVAKVDLVDVCGEQVPDELALGIR